MLILVSLIHFASFYQAQLLLVDAHLITYLTYVDFSLINQLVEIQKKTLFEQEHSSALLHRFVVVLLNLVHLYFVQLLAVVQVYYQLLPLQGLILIAPQLSTLGQVLISYSLILLQNFTVLTA